MLSQGISKRHKREQEPTHASRGQCDCLAAEMNPPRFSALVRRRVMVVAIALVESTFALTLHAGSVQFTTAAGYAAGNLNGQPASAPKWAVVSGSTAYTIPAGAGQVNLNVTQTASQFAAWQVPVNFSATATCTQSVDFVFTQSAGTGGANNFLGVTFFTAPASGNANIRAYFGRSAGTDTYHIGFYSAGSPGTSVSQNVTGVNLGLNSLGGDNTTDTLRLTYTLEKGATSWLATVDLTNVTTGALIGHVVSTAFVPATTFSTDTSVYPAYSTETIQSAAISSLKIVGADLPGAGPASPAEGLTLTFSDEFNGGGLDRTKWSPHMTKAAAVSQEANVLNAFSTAPNGTSLRITTTNTPFAGKSWSSGAMTNYGSFSQSYGYFEARLKVPKGSGFWPAFWMLPTDQSWPPEIDILEILGKDTTTVHQTLHWPGTSGQDVGAGQATTGADLSLDYHIYGVSWKPQEVIFYLDNVETYRVTGTNVPSKPMYLIANTAIGPLNGGSWSQMPNAQTVFPNYLDIDYIRAYQYPNMPAVQGPAITLGISRAVPETVTAGNPVVINSTIKSGGTAFTTTPIHLYVLDFWGAALSPAVDIVVPAKSVAANGSTAFSGTYNVPATLPAGTYTVKIQTNISGTSTYVAIGCATRFVVSP